MSEPGPRSPYLLIPQRLIADLRDNPVALGAYALIARLFLIHHQPVPLSASDLERFDGQTSYGQARRALDRLAETGWATVIALGRKNTYLPTWGVIAGQARPWVFGAEKLGRPPHVRTIRLDAVHLDQIGRLSPHPRLTAIIVPGELPGSLSQVGRQILTDAGIDQPSPKGSDGATAMFRRSESIDQLIPQLIDNHSAADAPSDALDSAQNSMSSCTRSIPWDSWDQNQSINQQASLCLNSDSGMVAADTEAQQLSPHETANRQMLPVPQQGRIPDDQIMPEVRSGHLALNSDRPIVAGEWFELLQLQRAHGADRLLMWQARAGRRNDPVRRITPDYYRACAAGDMVETLPPQRRPEQVSALPVALEPLVSTQPHMSTPTCVERLRQLGIQSVAGLGAIAPDLLARWEELRASPAWEALGDNPPAVARAMLLRGAAPPDPQILARRLARRRQAEPTDWAALVARSDGYARRGDDLEGLTARTPEPIAPQHAHEAPEEQATYPRVSNEDLVEQLRMTLRLHAPTRAAFQAVERISVVEQDEAICIRPGRSEDRAFLGMVRPVIERVCQGRPVVLL